MIRTIDGDARRRLLVRAVWDLLREGGLDAASVRSVAAATGLSSGSVRHFFPTQTELHVFAMRELYREVAEDVQAVFAGELPMLDVEIGWTPTEARRRVAAVLHELLPLTDRHMEMFRVHLQFTAKAATDSALRPVADQGSDEMHNLYGQLVALLVHTGSAPADLDVARTASDLGVMMDGLAWRRMTAPHLLSVEATYDSVTAFIDRLALGVDS
ncbi:TetR/AcrR family transcriptional regulator [Gordonia sp. CPCC 205333]|uniref:TetR/AcrR family transcriptional regulator n=1 Tax=Gordonia sp. CPCC 205333 TaxID=3140790 RepID=UPI003AF35842